MTSTLVPPDNISPLLLLFLLVLIPSGHFSVICDLIFVNFNPPCQN